ncbi:MAG TPA: hypothetical protein VLX28_00795 [Thermoanaerobaculia bacterium]|nr:hypothetical protein [Thermoanaerobaculia bacterium]
MRRIALFAILMLTLCTMAAWAKTPVPPLAMDKAQFLASLGAPQPVEAASRRGIQPKSSCTVTLTCDVGAYHLQCTSSSGNCSAGSTWVSCDGNQQNCPICYKTRSCCDGTTLECWGWSFCQNVAPRSIQCDDDIEGPCPPLSQCIQ